MILYRIGNKKRIAFKIQKYFPKHNTYIEPFFGAGGMFFQKPKAKYNLLNDLDSDVFNLWQVVMYQKEELAHHLKAMPIHVDLLEFWLANKETEPIKKALRFLLLSNFTYLGKGHTLRLGANNTEKIILSKLDETQNKLFGCRFDNADFRCFLNSIAFRHPERDPLNTFIYCDPPYIGTDNNYSDSFLEQDFVDLLNCLHKTGCKFAISEFDSDFVVSQAKERNLFVVDIGERQNLKNRRNEILITNYQTQNALF